MTPMLLLASALKLVCEIALMALLGRFVLGLLAGAKRAGNPFYQLLDTLVRPVEKLVRAITPSFVVDRHIPHATAALLLGLWLFALLWKVDICRGIGVQQCL